MTWLAILFGAGVAGQHGGTAGARHDEWRTIMSNIMQHSTRTGLITEKVSQGVQIRPGEYGSATFWIAYPPNVAAYGHDDDRISRAWGTGKLRRDALAAAEQKITEGWAVS